MRTDIDPEESAKEYESILKEYFQELQATSCKLQVISRLTTQTFPDL
jgi:hypothetical protein